MIERIGSLGFVAAIAFLAFIGGAVAVLGEYFPYQYLRDAYTAGEALIAQREQTTDRLQTDQWRIARSDDRGVTINDSELAYKGYTLYTSAGDPSAKLINMAGNVVHEWRQPFSAIWDKSAAVKNPQPDELVYMDKARLLPNGDLLAVYIAGGDTPWGYGLVKLDSDSNVVWRYLSHAHHDFDIAPNGTIYVLTNDFTSEELKGLEDLEQPRLDDFVAVLTPDGRETKKISLTQALAQSRFRSVFMTVPKYALSDPLHTNSVQYVTADLAKNISFAREGDLLLSFRNVSTIAVLDVESGKITWAARGGWLWQHDASLQSDGRITMFDNLGGFREANAARVVELDPETMALTPIYEGDEEQPMHSPLRSSAERLPNGNMLVTESDGGRLLEVSKEGQIVWSYINPVRDTEDERFIPVLSWGQRIDPKGLDPEFVAKIEQQKEAVQ